MTTVTDVVEAALSKIPQMVELPGGKFLMGQSDGRDEERPAHEVQVGPFGMGVVQVTNAQYEAFCAATGHSPVKFRAPSFRDPRQPVAGPSWFDAAAYCEWLSATSRRRFRLPTEAEWEWAARGGLEGHLFPCGNQPRIEKSDYGDLWKEGPEPAGCSAPNGYGLYEMCENVHEWCSDWYDPEYYARSPADNPKGPDKGVRRASRGGSWRHHIKISRCAARSSIPPEFEYADYGFRVACDV